MAIGFRLSEAASTSVTFSQTRSGRRVGGRCVAPSRSNARNRHCTRRVSVANLTLHAGAEGNRFRFRGRISRRKTLGPGSYTATITATDTFGSRSRSRTLGFRILPRRR
jgi:hypothetical protein